jgi:hypothetical protein
MRRALGPVIVVAAALAGTAIAPSCSHEARPAPLVAQAEDPPPLPPASGTPIGYLVDDAAELKLSDDQLTRLKAIDDDLAGKLAVLDGQQRGDAATPAAPRAQGGRGRSGAFRGGRQGGRSAMGGGPGARAGSGSGSGSAGTGGRRSRSRAGNASTTGNITEERAADVRAAIEKSFAMLDVVQRVIAKRVLADHGVDVDAGRPQATPAEPDESEPGESEPRGSGTGSG